MAEFFPRTVAIYRWDDFVEYAVEEGISLEHEEDWQPWWRCWASGIRCATEKSKEQLDATV